MTAGDGTHQWSEVIGQLVAGRDLTSREAGRTMSLILSGEATAAQISAFIVALRAKGETAEELQGMLSAVIEASSRVDLPPEIASQSIDIVGTGGDQSQSVNISTMASLVIAGAGVPVCKHGNRAATSQCGTADVLEELGVTIDIDGAGVAQCVVEAGMGFCYAPRFHPAFRHAGPSRREVGIPTAFNLLGPMANPAAVNFMVVGVGDPSVAPTMAHVLSTRGVQRAWIVHGHGGMDELSLSGLCSVTEMHNGAVSKFEIDAISFGLARADTGSVRGGSPQYNARVVREVLAGNQGPIRDIVVFNAAAGLVVAGKAETIPTALGLASDSIDSGAAQRVLDALIRISSSVGR
ncbi:MAG: anthranilate phosphoribosyltransferase [Ilumatobacteraceae bacterium]